MLRRTATRSPGSLWSVIFSAASTLGCSLRVRLGRGSGYAASVSRPGLARIRKDPSIRSQPGLEPRRCVRGRDVPTYGRRFGGAKSPVQGHSAGPLQPPECTHTPAIQQTGDEQSEAICLSLLTDSHWSAEKLSFSLRGTPWRLSRPVNASGAAFNRCNGRDRHGIHHVARTAQRMRGVGPAARRRPRRPQRRAGHARRGRGRQDGAAGVRRSSRRPDFAGARRRASSRRWSSHSRPCTSCARRCSTGSSACPRRSAMRWRSRSG